jgi:predicted RNase H-related nuclease YkuK (DUF458 family)
MNRYKLYYLSDCDDANWPRCETETEVEVGDILRLSCGFYHVVCAKKQLKKEIRLDVSKSCQSQEEALLVAEQHGYYPKPGLEPKIAPNVFGSSEVTKV